jgi:mannose-6-phosphate isomerase
VNKPWGTETLLTASDSPYCAKVLEIRANERLSLQSHTEKLETLVLESGLAEITVGEQTSVMPFRKAFNIPPNTPHRIKAYTDCVIFEASTPERGTTIRHEDDYGRGDESYG